MSREEDLSTQQARPQAPARLPRTYGDQRGPEGHRRTSRTRPQAPVGLTARSPDARPRAHGRASDEAIGFRRGGLRPPLPYPADDRAGPLARRRAGPPVRTDRYSEGGPRDRAEPHP